MDREKEIRFQPLTDGLGFHPFADGLPYAPTSKKPSSTAGNSSAAVPPPAPPRDYASGSGAVSAGQPRFAYPSQPVLPSTSVDAAAERIRRELEALQNQRLEGARKTAESMRPMLEIRYGLDYSFQRAFAFLLDTAFNLAVCASVLSTALLSTDVAKLKNLSPVAAITVGVFLFLCNWALLAAQEVAFGTTLGKRIFGLKLDGDGFSCFMRSILFIPSLLLAGFGIWIAIFDSRKRCWHDRMTKLQPEP